MDAMFHLDAVARSVPKPVFPPDALNSPIDVLQSVFRQIQISSYQQTFFRQSYPKATDFVEGPWTLSRVCGLWRDVVLSHPQLWSHIHLRCWSLRRRVHFPDPHHMILALRTMILRSEPHRLDIVFERQKPMYSCVSDPGAFQAFPMILEQSHRWKNVLLDISLDLMQQLVVVLGKVSCLESLTLQALCVGTNLPAVRSVFIDAPRLQQVALYGTSRVSDFMFPPHITSLAGSLANPSNFEAYQFLVECHLDSDLSLSTSPSPCPASSRRIH
ncbi:hypothetical protein DFS33DRAFT_1383780 [Desarmillaria ectypa]|nr:hypothetical protein DFS33DRAFT_1383780 [Desarmillaria ectypa]